MVVRLRNLGETAMARSIHAARARTWRAILELYEEAEIFV